MNWIQRFKTRKNRKDQTITLELSAAEWAELQEWARSHDWTPQYTVTRWIKNRMHGAGLIGN